jgi:hypothetical protein
MRKRLMVASPSFSALSDDRMTLSDTLEPLEDGVRPLDQPLHPVWPRARRGRRPDRIGRLLNSSDVMGSSLRAWIDDGADRRRCRPAAVVTTAVRRPTIRHKGAVDTEKVSVPL